MSARKFLVLPGIMVSVFLMTYNVQSSQHETSSDAGRSEPTAESMTIPTAETVPLSANPADTPPPALRGLLQPSEDTDLAPAYGPTLAKVHVIVFSDFQCGACRRAADASRDIAAEFPGDVRLEFWQHPLNTHGSAEDAAVASLAAHRQGKFWDFHDELFRNQNALDEFSLLLYAHRVGLDEEQFQADYEDAELRTRVREEAAFAGKMGAGKTPAFLINGKLHEGWGSWYGFRTLVERERNHIEELEAQGTSREKLVSKRVRENLADRAQWRRYRSLALDPLVKAAE